MTVQLHSLSQSRGIKRKAKRVGRGNASGRGTYSARGMKGQRARSGGKGGLKLKGFKQNLLNFPKFKGMLSAKPAKQTITLQQLQACFAAGDKVTPEALVEKKLIKMAGWVKLVKTGELNIALTISGVLASAGAIEAVEKAGGKITVPSYKKEKKA